MTVTLLKKIYQQYFKNTFIAITSLVALCLSPKSAHRTLVLRLDYLNAMKQAKAANNTQRIIRNNKHYNKFFKTTCALAVL